MARPAAAKALHVVGAGLHSFGSVNDGLRSVALPVEVAHGLTLPRRTGFVESGWKRTPPTSAKGG